MKIFTQIFKFSRLGVGFNAISGSTPPSPSLSNYQDVDFILQFATSSIVLSTEFPPGEMSNHTSHSSCSPS